MTASVAFEGTRFVTQGGAYPDAGGLALGVARCGANTAGDLVPVDVQGTALVECGGAIARDGPVAADAQGRAVAATGAGVTALARALEDGATGDLIEVLLIPVASPRAGWRAGHALTGVRPFATHSIGTNMPQATLSQARVIDPILTTVAHGWSSPKASIANVLFPIVGVSVRAGRILSFGPDDFKLINTARAPGANTKRIQFGYASEKFSLADYRLEGAVPRELQQEAQAVPGIDLGANAVRRVQNMMSLEREQQAAGLARAPGNYDASNKTTLSGDAQWSNPKSDPFTDIINAKEVIRGQIGERPNVLALGPKALTALRTHPKVLDRLSTASDRPPATVEQLQRLDNIVEGEAVMHDGSSFKDVWGNDAILAYTTPASQQEMGSPNYGYTYQLEGLPTVEEPYYDDNTVTWYYPVTDAYQAVIAGKSAGFLFRAAAA